MLEHETNTCNVSYDFERVDYRRNQGEGGKGEAIVVQQATTLIQHLGKIGYK